MAFQKTQAPPKNNPKGCTRTPEGPQDRPKTFGGLPKEPKGYPKIPHTKGAYGASEGQHMDLQGPPLATPKHP